MDKEPDPKAHDQDSEPPRTAVPPGEPGGATKDQTGRDQDSEAPRTAVPPKK